MHKSILEKIADREQAARTSRWRTGAGRPAHRPLNELGRELAELATARRASSPSLTASPNRCAALHCLTTPSTIWFSPPSPTPGRHVAPAMCARPSAAGSSPSTSRACPPSSSARSDQADHRDEPGLFARDDQ